MTRTLAIALLAIFGLFPQSSQTAREQFAELRRQAHTARASGDKQGYVQAALKVQSFLNGAPDAVESVAFAYAEAGDSTRALDSLARFARMGQVDEALIDGSNKGFAEMADSPRYQAILAQFARNKAAVSRTERAFALPDAGTVAEDIDYDSATKTFLITSVLEKKIIRVTASGVSTEFAQSPSHWPMLAIKIDAVRKLVWATEVALNGFSVVEKSEWGRSAILCYDLSTGKQLRRVEGPPHSALGDMALAQNGDPIVSDGAQGGVYRLVAGNLVLLNGKDFISPQTPAVLPGCEHVIVPDYLRGIGVLDLRDGQVEWLSQNVPGNIAVNGVDGLYFIGDSLFLTQNGTSPERVVRLRLDHSITHIESSQVIEQATPSFGDPTHGVLVGNSFYYIANSGWSELDEHGDVKHGSRLTPAMIMRFGTD